MPLRVQGQTDTRTSPAESEIDMSIVYAASTVTTTAPNGLRVALTKGEPWAADDPLVKQRPDLFTTAPEVRRTVAPVEQATAAPGQRRNTKRG